MEVIIEIDEDAYGALVRVKCEDKQFDQEYWHWPTAVNDIAELIYS